MFCFYWRGNANMENRKQADSQEEQLALKEERRYENAGEEDAPVFCKVASGLP